MAYYITTLNTINTPTSFYRKVVDYLVSLGVEANVKPTGGVSFTVNDILFEFSTSSDSTTTMDYDIVFCDTKGCELFFSTKAYIYNSDTRLYDYSHCLCTRQYPKNNFLKHTISSSELHRLFNIPKIQFNNNKNIIVPAIYSKDSDIVLFENIYISATGVNLSPGTIVSDGINKFISLGLCFYQKYIEE